MSNDNTAIHELGIGIDTARNGHRVAIFRDDRQPIGVPFTVLETRAGYDLLTKRLERLVVRHPDARLRIHVDAAGQYAENLLHHLRALAGRLPLVISVGEPKRNKDYHSAMSPKRADDDTESRAMARFAVVERPEATPAPSPQFRVLREIGARLQAAVRDRTRALNRLHNLLARTFPELVLHVGQLAASWLLILLDRFPTAEALAAAPLDELLAIKHARPATILALRTAAACSVGSLRGVEVEWLLREIVDDVRNAQGRVDRLEKMLLRAHAALPEGPHRHLASIPGIGVMTAAVLSAVTVDIGRFATGGALVGYYGAFPRASLSGVDRQGRPFPGVTMRMSAKGNDLVRSYLWMAAKSAARHNPAIRSLYVRLRGRGKGYAVAIGHCMRKLLHQAHAVWSGDCPYDELKALGPQPAANAEADSTAEPLATPEPIATVVAPPVVAPPVVAPPVVETRRVEPPQDNGAEETKKAAGRKRASPRRSAVTAAESSVAPPTASVKRRPKIDFAALRERITIRQVLARLELLDGFHGRDELRGPCPIHGGGERSKSFAVNLAKNVYCCHNARCGSHGNVLDLWAAHHRLPLYEAAVDLARAFALELPTTTNREEEPVSATVPSKPAQPRKGVITPDAC